MIRPLSYTSKIKVPFHDVDSASIVWHGHYVKYLEVARCELLDSFNYNYDQMIQSGYFWPVIDMRLRYVGPSVFGQDLLIVSTIVEWENRLKINYLISCALTGKRLTRASTLQVAVDIETKEMLYESPKIIFEKLGITV